MDSVEIKWIQLKSNGFKSYKIESNGFKWIQKLLKSAKNIQIWLTDTEHDESDKHI